MIRPLRADDLPGLTLLVQSLLPATVVTCAGLAHLQRWTDWWVAEADGEIVGGARAGRGGRAWVGVHAEARRSGVGAALLDQVETRLRQAGEQVVEGWSDDEAGAGFAAARGYVRARGKPVSLLDLATTELPPLEPPEGVRLHRLGDLAHRMRELHGLAAQCYADEPGGAQGEMPFGRWLEEDMGLPDISREGSIVAEAGGELVAYAILLTDGATRGENDFTGTRREYRNRGLARLVKLASLHWAREHGVREVWTGNDEENAPMLSVNRGLGYRITHTRSKHVRRL
ncbi:MAG TPA: GNAT family N-acetyltransferase [Gaiellaceae bacterium]|nr:GNAT family N-acetyltransferase [Gaiellaceae bacterium]